MTTDEALAKTVELLCDESNSYVFISTAHCGVGFLFRAVTGMVGAADSDSQLMHPEFVFHLREVARRLDVDSESPSVTWWALSDLIGNAEDEGGEDNNRYAAIDVFEEAMTKA